MRKKKLIQNLFKHNERKKRQMSMPDVWSLRKTHKLAHNEYLAPFIDVILEEYKPIDISLYRWMHNPPVPDDFKPQIYQENNPNRPETIKAPPADAPKDVKLEFTDMFTLSNFTSVHNAKHVWRKTLKKRIDGKSDDKKEKEINKWINNKGQWIFKVDYTKTTSLTGPGDDDIHKQVFLFEGVNPKDLIDKSFTPIKIEII